MKTRLIVLTSFLFAVPLFGAQAQQNPPLPEAPRVGTETPLADPLTDAEPVPQTELEPQTEFAPGTPLPYGAFEVEPEIEEPPAPVVYRVRAGAQPMAVLTSLHRLLNRGGNRLFFGLPKDVNWRAEQGIRIAIYSDQREDIAPFLEAAAMQFSEVTGLTIELVTARRLAAVAGAEATRDATGANLEILFGPRAIMTQFAGGVGMNRTILTRFREGRWPFGFVLPRQESWTGRVFIARDEPSEAIEASLILALVWALGGVSLGDEMQGLIDPFSVQPTLTPLGQSVFSLMYHPDLEAGLPISEALSRAQRLVEQDLTKSTSQSIQ